MHDPACLILNYLMCFYPDHSQDFNAKILKNFFFWILHDLHYRMIRHSAAHFILDEVQPYFRNNHLMSEFEKLKTCLPFQMVPMERLEDSLSVLELWYKNNNSKYNSIRVIPFKDSKIIVLQMKQDGCLEVYLHSQDFVIDQGALHPLSPLSCLYYTDQFELDPLKTHQIYHPPHQFFQFEYKSPNNIFFKKLKFPEGENITETQLKKIEDCEELFIHLKTMENYYIKPKSDPVYKSLIQSLQNCYQLLIANHPHAVRESTACLEQARTAVKNFYSNDRLLLLLFANIEYRLRHKVKTVESIITGKSELKEKDPFIQEVLYTQQP